MPTCSSDGSDTPSPFDILFPDRQTVPLVFASPHSGRNYPPDFVAGSRLDPVSLRRSEDSFVDDLFAASPDFGAPLLRALFPRAFIDPNREPFELDQSMFSDELPDYVNTESSRVAAGLAMELSAAPGAPQKDFTPVEPTQMVNIQPA